MKFTLSFGKITSVKSSTCILGMKIKIKFNLQKQNFVILDPRLNYSNEERIYLINFYAILTEI